MVKNIIEGKFIKLGNFEEEFFKIIVENQWDIKFFRPLSWDTFHPYTIEDWKNFVGDSDTNSRFLFAIINKESKEFIGWTSLSDIQFKNRVADLSMAILKEDNRNRGLGKDALNVILNFAFYELGLHKVNLSVHSNNIPAIKLYSSAGFVKEGTDREALFQDGNWLDVYYYGIIDSEWVNKTQISKQ